VPPLELAPKDLPPLRGLRLAFACVWLVAVTLAYLAAAELGLALVP
jgi:hypothetical protein